MHFVIDFVPTVPERCFKLIDYHFVLLFVIFFPFKSVGVSDPDIAFELKTDLDPDSDPVFKFNTDPDPGFF
jgi:hypothetical protein